MSKDAAAQGFGDYLARALFDAGYATPTDLARAVGVEPSTIARLINGEASPTLKTLQRLAPALSLEPAELINRAYPTGEPAPAPERRQPHVLGVELGWLLAEDSPLPATDRERLASVVEAVIEPYRQRGKRRARSA